MSARADLFVAALLQGEVVRIRRHSTRRSVERKLAAHMHLLDQLDATAFAAHKIVLCPKCRWHVRVVSDGKMQAHGDGCPGKEGAL